MGAVHVRSGRGFSATFDAPDDALLDLESLNRVAFAPADDSSQMVKVEAAAPLGALAAQLDERRLFLPLGEASNAAQSAAAALVGPARAALLPALEWLEAVDADGKPERLEGDAAREAVRGGASGLVLTEIGLRATPLGERWTTCWLLPYATAHFLRECMRRLAEAHVRVGVRVHRAAFGEVVINVWLSGTQAAERQAAENTVRQALRDAARAAAPDDRNDGDDDDEDAVFAGERCTDNPVSALLATHRESSAHEDGANERRFRGEKRECDSALAEALAAFIDAGAQHARNGSDVGMTLDTELNFDSDGQVSVDAVALASKLARADVLDKLTPLAQSAGLTEPALSVPHALFAAVKPPSTARLAVAKGSGEGDDVAASTTRGDRERGVGAMTALSLLSAKAPSPIPNFKGPVFEKRVGDRDYEKSIEQYARSSFSPAVQAARITPLIVAYPEDENDVVAAIKYAASKNLHVVARSGGHHYSGLLFLCVLIFFFLL